MKLFRKQIPPEEAGARLYEALRSSVAAPGGELSLARLVGRLGGNPDQFPEQYIGEVMVGVMFAASLAVERSTSGWLAAEILRGMRAEFLRHLREQGALPEQVDEWERILFSRSGDYRRTLQGYAELEPPWKLGRQFLWAVTGVEDYTALPVKFATLYLLAARDRAQEVLNACGPQIRVVPPVM